MTSLIRKIKVLVRRECEEKRRKDLEEWRDSAGTEEEFEILTLLLEKPQYRLDVEVASCSAFEETKG